MAVEKHPYRPEIDGLRAIAVVAVVVFHAFPRFLHGGFRGVDVFFVISGYLITGILLRDVATDRYSLREFYRRRIRRLFPALSLVLLTLLVIGLVALLPIELAQLAKHVVGGSFFASNLALWAEVGYFDGAAVNKPLLHLWSLGVEEQFYLVWPLFIAFAVRRRAVGAGLAVVLVASFTVAALSARMSPGSGFYNPLSRFWELGIGAGLVYAESRLSPAIASGTRHATIASSIGVVLLAIAFREQPDGIDVSAWRGLLPTLGAALIIAAGQRSCLNRTIFSSRPFVWFGKISYPMYLWHWPLLAIPQIILGRTPVPAIRLGAIASSVVLAHLTYSQVELRVRKNAPSLLASTKTWIGAMALTASIGAVLWWTKGLPTVRGPWNVTNIAGFGAAPEPSSPGCAARYGTRIATGRRSEWFCHANFGATETPEIVVLGDSHAHRLAWGLRETGALRVLNLSKGTCLPFANYEVLEAGHSEIVGCHPTVSKMLDVAVAEHPRDGIVLTGFFGLLYDGRVSLRTTATIKELMRSTLADLSSKTSRVIVMLDVPELPDWPSACVERPYQRWLGHPAVCEFSRARAMAQRSQYEADLREAAASLPNVTFFDPWDVICDGDRCSPVRDGELLYDDPNHLSHVGATLVARRFLAVALGVR